MTNAIEHLKMLQEILESVENVSEEAVQRAERDLGPHKSAGEGYIGVIDSPFLQKLWTLGFIYKGQAAQYHNMAQFESRDEEEADNLRLQSHRYNVMSKICQEIFWAEAKSFFGKPAFECDSVGLRNGFTMVSRKEHPEGIMQMMRFPFPGSDE